MKYRFLVAVLTIFITVTATAGVKDKKAMRDADEKITKQLVITKNHCGNSNLNVEVSWNKFKSMAESNQDLLKSKGYKSQWIMNHTGERTISVLEAMSKICSADSDYKEEIALLTKIIILPKASFDDSKNKFSLEGNILTVLSGHRMSRSYSDFIEPIKSLY